MNRTGTTGTTLLNTSRARRKGRICKVMHHVPEVARVAPNDKLSSNVPIPGAAGTVLKSLVPSLAWTWGARPSRRQKRCGLIPDSMPRACIRLQAKVSSNPDGVMTAILGISAYYHDSAAALVVDGDIVAAAQEERFSRKKHDPSFPTQAAAYCLREAGLKPDQLGYVAFYDKPLTKFER